MEQQGKQPLKIAILGKATSSRDLAPFNDPSWRIWILSDNFAFVPRFDKWYELHSIDEGRGRWRAGYWEKMIECQDRLVIQAPHPDLPKARVFPLDDVLENFGSYHTSTVSYMIADAILQGASEIGLWGIDMACSDPARGNNGEYEHQRPSCEFILGVALGRGIGITIPDQSDILKANRLYAFESHKGEAYQKYIARIQELNARSQAAQQREEMAKVEKIACEAAKDNMKYFFRYLGDADHSPWKQRQKILRLTHELRTTKEALAKCQLTVQTQVDDSTTTSSELKKPDGLMEPKKPKKPKDSQNPSAS